MVRANTDGNMCRGDAAIILRLAIDAEWVEDHSIRQWVVHGRRNGPVGVEDVVGRLATMATYKSRKEGIEEVPTTVPDPPQAGGVTTEPEIGKQRPKRNAGIVARRATRRASVGRSVPTWRKGNLQRSHYAKGTQGSGRVGKGPTFVMRPPRNRIRSTCR
mgnify:CR=1 FL=1